MHIAVVLAGPAFDSSEQPFSARPVTVNGVAWLFGSILKRITIWLEYRH